MTPASCFSAAVSGARVTRDTAPWVKPAWLTVPRRGLLAAALIAIALPAAPAAAQTLQESLAQAYVGNPTLKAARAELRTTNEQIPQELAAWRPQVTVTGTLGKQRIDQENGSGSAGTTSGFSGDDDPETTTPRSIDLNVTQTLYRGGQTVAGTRRAEAEVEAQRARLLTTEQDILFRSATAYMDVWRDQSVLQLNINNENVLRRQLEASRDRFEVGEVTRTDVAQSESRLARAVADRVQAEGDLTESRAIYQELVGSMPGTLRAPPPVDGLPGAQQEVIDAARVANPVVVAAQFSEKAERNNARAQFGQLLPELALVGTLSRSEESSNNDSKTEQGQILAQLTLPIYQQGFVSSQVREAKQRASQLRLEIDEARRNVEQASITAWEALQTARAQTRAFEAEVRATEIALEGVRQENAVGARTILDILDAEQEFLDAQVSLVRAQRDDIVAGYQVLQAMGRMIASFLKLPVKIYDPDVDLNAVRDVWFGFGDIPEGTGE